MVNRAEFVSLLTEIFLCGLVAPNIITTTIGNRFRLAEDHLSIYEFN